MRRTSIVPTYRAPIKPLSPTVPKLWNLVNCNRIAVLDDQRRLSRIERQSVTERRDTGSKFRSAAGPMWPA